jgi:hypothetical protein
MGMMVGSAIMAWNTLDRFAMSDFVPLDRVLAEFRFNWDRWLAGAVAGGVLGARLVGSCGHLELYSLEGFLP